jgi:hypothetical protein
VLGGDGIWLGDRHYAVGDHIMALRNDRRIGVLNGTETVLAAIDHDRRQLVVRSDRQSLKIPFEYAERWLTHAYATTIHKAQGATVDRLVGLADDTVSREMLYTLMSRGRLSNDLFATTADWRHELRHTIEVEPEPLDVLRRAVHRTSSQHMAIDTAVDGRFASREELAAERAQLRGTPTGRPPDPTSDLRRVEGKLRDSRAELERLMHEREAAGEQSARLGPVAKRIHRRERRRVEDKVERLDRRITETGETVADLGRYADVLQPRLHDLHRWQQDHEPALRRLEALDELLSTTLSASAFDGRGGRGPGAALVPVVGDGDVGSPSGLARSPVHDGWG